MADGIDTSMHAMQPPCPRGSSDRPLRISEWSKQLADRNHAVLACGQRRQPHMRSRP
jgi:hypothetical protein